MNKTVIKNIETGIEKKCDILNKNDKILEVVLENTTIKIFLKKHNNIYVGKYKNMEFTSSGNQTYQYKFEMNLFYLSQEIY